MQKWSQRMGGLLVPLNRVAILAPESKMFDDFVAWVCEG
jgi:hypothetical protein